MPRAASPEVLLIASVATPTGLMRAVFDEAARLRALEWADHEPRLQHLLRLHYGAPGRGHALRAAALPGALAAALGDYFAGALTALDTLVTQTAGSAFQRAVWQALRAIPVGTTTTYGALATALGRPRAVRAVGAANGANPIAIVVPCHRVLGAGGALTGYGGGLPRKRWLLEHEGVLLGVDSTASAAPSA